MAHDRQAIVVAKAKQGWYYNRHTHPLTKLKSGEGVHIIFLVKSPGPLEYVKDLQVPDHTTCVLELTPIGATGGT